MRQMEQAAGWGGAERKRVEAVMETLAHLRGEGESVAEVAHDARNMVTALGLYCDLLEEPGVLAPPFVHYGNELRLVAAASRRLVEKLVALDSRATPGSVLSEGGQRGPGKLPAGSRTARTRLGRGKLEPGNLEMSNLKSSKLERAITDRPGCWELLPAQPVDNLAAELLATRNLLAALVGPSIALTVDAEGGARPVRLSGEDLTRVLVNLVKNAAEAMPSGGRIRIGLRERTGEAGDAASLVLTMEDNGPGIPAEALDKIFESGYTTRPKAVPANGGWVAAHRGLGLAITRSIVEAAGGRISVANRVPAGARFEIELPVRTG